MTNPRVLSGVKMDEKEKIRKMYGFESGEAFDLFYAGVVKLLHARSEEDAQESVRLFDESIEKDSTNKHTRIFRAIASNQRLNDE
jgi:hypothetical protein